MANKQNPWLWVGIGCAVVLAALVAFIAFIVMIVFGAMRSSEPYRTALAHARGDARVAEALGTPVERGWFVSGTINTQNRDGDCDLSIPISGPKQKATLRVIGTKTDGRWSYSRMVVTPENGSPIDLLASPAESTSTAPPGG